jgi:hypothetical protein
MAVPTYQQITSKDAQTQIYREAAHRALLDYQAYSKAHGVNSAGALHLLNKNKYFLGKVSATQNQSANAANQWVGAGRPGADALLASRYKTPEEIASKLMPFDPQGGVDALTAKRTLDQNLINLTGQENQLNSQYGSSRRDYENKIPELARNLLSGYAGRGMAFSSGYGTAVGKQQADIASGLSSLDQQKNQQLSDITAQRGLANTGYKNDLASSLVGTVNRLSSRAGTLGYGPKGKDIYNDPILLTKLAQKLLAAGG